MLTNDKAERKAMPMARGVLDYFPDALAEVARVSGVGNEQHNPGQPMHWSKHLSTDHADCILRHMVDRGTVDVDGLLHSAKVAWRALAMLQIEIEEAAKARPAVDLSKLTEKDLLPLCQCGAIECHIGEGRYRCRRAMQACDRKADGPH